MGNKVSNFFKQDWNSIKDFVGGAGDVLKDTIGGLTGSGWDYSDAGRAFHNYGQDVKDAFTGGTGGKWSAPVNPAVAAAKKAQALSNFYDPNTVANRSLWQGSVAISYSPQSGLGGITPPSHLNAISDPTTKVAIAGTRGTMRSTFQQYQMGTDALASQQISSAVPIASQTTNSAGGTGVATSMDTQ